MSTFTRLVRFRARHDGQVYFADLGKKAHDISPGDQLTAFRSLDDLLTRTRPTDGVVDTVLAPVPNENIPIYCVGLNYHSHAKEADLSTPKVPPLWTKPCTALSHPDTPIFLTDYTAKALPDYEGELVFITSRPVKDISPSEAGKAILGYTVGNDVSCRMFQLKDYSAGQFFYAKAFDGFAPIGPVLVSPSEYESSSKRLVTKVNGKVVQNADLAKDMIFTPAQILSHMSQSTTIPAFTAVMTGTPAGVGAFMKPKSFLKDGDQVEICIEGVTTLRNKVAFQ